MENQAEGNVSACHCQFHGRLPISWHLEICESIYGK
jgi:hypothetical protein